MHTRRRLTLPPDRSTSGAAVAPAAVASMTAAGAPPPIPVYARFRCRAMREGRTDEGGMMQREFVNVTWRPGPQPLFLQDRSGHGAVVVDGGELAGQVDRYWRESDGWIWAEGAYYDWPAGRRAAQLAAQNGPLRGVSVEPGGVGSETYDETTQVWSFDGYQIGALSQVGVPAFAGAGIVEVEMIDGEVVPGDAVALAASAAVQDAPEWMVRCPSSALLVPEPAEPTPVTVLADGTWFGHLAVWDSCHTAWPDKCVTPPRSPSGYAEFHQSPVMLTDRGVVAKVGRFSVGGGHAAPGLHAKAAVEHYDSTSTCAAFGRVVDGNVGIWCCGIINPDAPESAVRQFASAPLSGDWRGKPFRLYAALSVNSPGFPILTDDSLVAAGWVPTGADADSLVASAGPDLDPDAVHARRAIADRIARSIGQPSVTERNLTAAAALRSKVGTPPQRVRVRKG